MAGRKTTMMRVDAEMADQLHWLAEHDRLAGRTGKGRRRPASDILRGIAGAKVRAAFARIEPWVKTVQAAMAEAHAKPGK